MFKDITTNSLLAAAQFINNLKHKVMTLNEYLGEYHDPFGYDVAANVGRMKTLRAQKRWEKFQEERAQAYYEVRAQKIAEYKSIYGEQPIDRVKELISAANGHPDNESTLAARRVCKKRGINWSLTTCYNLKDNNN